MSRSARQAGITLTALRVLIVHNAYQQRGGEDAVVEAEVDLLRQNGHATALYRRDNRDLDNVGRIAALGQTLWSRRTVRDIGALAADFQPDVIHAHNTFPLISPSLYWGAQQLAVPVVQTLHNFRLLCPQAMFLRNGAVCEDCLAKVPWRGVLRRCYRGSYAQSAALASMLCTHRAIGTFQHKVARYIALSEFGRRKFIEGGLPAARISVKPNFADVPVTNEQERQGGLFVGRLSPEKGVGVLLDALARSPGCRVRVAGSGPQEAELRRCADVELLGWQPFEATLDEMRRARFLIMPSICYEGFPRTLAEAFACGLPVIASRLGVLEESIRDGETGLLFAAASSAELADKIDWAERNPVAMHRMGRNARMEYEAKYSPDSNYKQLMAIYLAAIYDNEQRAAAA